MGGFLEVEQLARFEIEIRGLGLILYSPFAVAQIQPGENYLAEHFWEPADVARQVNAGTLSGFATGSPGRFQVEVVRGTMVEPFRFRHDWWIALALEVRDRTVCIRDLYDLHRWEPACPVGQSFTVDDGYYHLSVGSSCPESGRIGDGQEVWMLFERVAAPAEIVWPGVPYFGVED